MTDLENQKIFTDLRLQFGSTTGALANEIYYNAISNILPTQQPSDQKDELIFMYFNKQTPGNTTSIHRHNKPKLTLDLFPLCASVKLKAVLLGIESIFIKISIHLLSCV